MSSRSFSSKAAICTILGPETFLACLRKEQYRAAKVSGISRTRFASVPARSISLQWGLRLVGTGVVGVLGMIELLSVGSLVRLASRSDVACIASGFGWAWT